MPHRVLSETRTGTFRVSMVNRNSAPRRARRWHVQSDVDGIFPSTRDKEVGTSTETEAGAARGESEQASKSFPLQGVQSSRSHFCYVFKMGGTRHAIGWRVEFTFYKKRS